LQQLWLRFLQFYLTIGFKFYYKKFEAVYLDEIPKDKAVIYLSNHQNALLDPLLITLKSTRKNYFLTQAAVFKNPIAAKILYSLQMLPVYRIRDGVNTVQKNFKIFAFCAELLHQKNSILLFPEGGHSLKRKVRPLKKGVSRILEETFQKYPKTEIVIIPIGVNYQNPKKYGDSMSVYFGNHISPNQFWDGDSINFNDLAKAISDEMKKLTTHIESIADYDNSINKLSDLQVDFTNPIEVNKSLENDFNYTGKKVKKESILYPFFKMLVKIFYFIPYYIWKKIAFPKIKEEEYIATFRYALIISITPIYLVLGLLITCLLFGKTIGLTFLLIGILLPLITLRIK